VRAGAAGAAAVGFLLALIVTSVPVVALLAGAGCAAIPYLVLRRIARRRRDAMRDAWPAVIDELGSAVRAGLSLPTAVADVGLVGPVALRAPFARAAGAGRATTSFDRALDELAAACADPVADRVVAALRIASDLGGSDLGQLLRALSGALRADLRQRGEIAARQSWTVSAARLAVAAPWITLALLCLRPGTAAAYASPTGTALLLVAALATLAAYAAMVRIARLPDEMRRSS
jgi:tight adherence protein B